MLHHYRRLRPSASAVSERRHRAARKLRRYGRALAATALCLLAPSAFAQAGADGERPIPEPLWRSEGFQRVQEFYAWPGPQAAFSPDSKTIAACADKQIELRDARRGSLIKRFGPHPYDTLSVRWSPDGALIAVTMLSETIRWANQPDPIKPEWRKQCEVYVWGVADGKLRARCVGHRMQVVGSLFSPDSRRLLTFGIDESMRLWDVTDGGEDAVFETRVAQPGSLTPSRARWGAFSVSPMRLITSQCFGIYDRDPHTGRTLNGPMCTGGQQPVFAVSPKGQVVVCSQDSCIQAASAYEVSLRARRTKEGPAEKNPVVAPAPPWSNNAFLMFADVRHTGREGPPPTTPWGWAVLDDKYDYGRGGGPAFSRDGKHLYVSRLDAANRRFELTIWDAEGWRIERVYRGERSYIPGVLGFSPDGRYLVEGRLGYWDLKTGEWKKPPPESPNLPIGSDISNDGLLLLRYGAVDGTLEVWDFIALEQTFVAEPTRPKE